MRKRGDKERARFKQRLEDRLFDLRMWIPYLAQLDTDFIPYGKHRYVNRAKRAEIAKQD